ncbi:MAG: TM0996/MTH895 family glutaredoxin-like protein [Gemmatimonadota bacterium]|nr:MAG: TM0996/MTH895 family glutaredoxin-like protein [Gemmatimonadota bacterium]
MKIEVMGPGCLKCEATERNARTALVELGLDAEVEHIYDVREYVRRGVTITPALAVDGEVKVAGHVPSVKELKGLLGRLESSL